ncbi:uncharacterized protein LOC124413963 [Diprion similis]|uniref:uncharacterized protein LOC124413963 n=1 Tax=Diprion similis TaxID=362088 RepID=UPI001EF818DD|nr:uncharacterized protein LOC124413963 [Diprion similis]
MSSLSLLPNAKQADARGDLENSATDEGGKLSAESNGGKARQIEGDGGLDFSSKDAYRRYGKRKDASEAAVKRKMKTEGKSRRGKFSGGRSNKRRGYNGEDDDAVEAEGLEADEQGAVESLPSCLSISAAGSEELPLSHDGRWLRRHFKKPLTRALRDIANKKPADPVDYLAFWLRKYRSNEEHWQRKQQFENELRSLRIEPTIQQEEPIEDLEVEYSVGEEGGGNADWNYQNYHPTTPNLDPSETASKCRCEDGDSMPMLRGIILIVE